MENNSIRSVVIVGAGQAGIQTAQALRKRGFDGDITLLGDEGYSPYQRPPLSKAFLKGETDESRLAIRPERFFVEQRIQCQFANAAVSIDTAARRVICDDGNTVAYDRLVLGTGATPMELPIGGAELAGVFSLRGINDSQALRQSLAGASRLVVVGGGYIGLEVAAVARQLGLEVSVVERLPRLLSRVTSAPVSDFYFDLHRRHGVNVLLGETVARIEGVDAVTGVTLASGVAIPADVVLVGVGVRPNDQLATAAGLDCEDGILVDADCRTTSAFIHAAGDCARSCLPDGTTVRLESVHNALDQGERIAAAIVGDERPPFDPPWFWSDQYDVKLQTVGLFNNHDAVVIRGDPDGQKFAALYFSEDRLIAIDAINDPISFMSGKRLLKQGLVIRQAEVENPAIDLKGVVAAKSQ